MSVSKAQEKAISSSSHTSVIACPGSGKTKTLIAKAVALLEAGCEELVIVSFTNASAKEIQNRLATEVSDKIVERFVKVGTFHSLLLKHIKTHAPHLKMMAPAHEHTKLKSILIELRLPKIPVDTLKEYIATPPSKRTQHEDFEEGAKIFKKYILETKQVTLTNIVEIATDMMISGGIPPIPAAHLFVDEFQDVDEWQLKLVLVHGLNGTIVTCVGDDDQAIYGWRSALGMDAFTTFNYHLKSEEVWLSKNYRSKKEIIDAAVKIVEQNRHRITKDIVCHQGEGGHVSIGHFLTDYDEALAVKQRLQQFSEGQLQTERIFVIARSNRYLSTLSSVLVDANIPFLNLSSMSIENDIIQLLLTALFGVSGDNKAILSVLKVITPYDAFKVYQAYLGKGSAPEHQSFSNMLKKGRGMVRDGKVDEAINLVIENTYNACNEANLIPQKENAQKAYAMRKDGLRNRMLKLEGSLKQRLRALTQKRQSNIPTGITLMTMHASKGLEAETVFLIGVARNIMPNKAALTEARAISDKKANQLIEEERRLLYVAMTRAEERLYIASVQGDDSNPSKYGHCELFPADFYQEYAIEEEYFE